MSRIGKLPVVLGDKVSASIQNNEIELKGPLGTLKLTFSDLVGVNLADNTVTVTPVDIENPLSKALWGTTRANINNMFVGVTTGYTKSLEINGVGYKFEVVGTDKLILSIGFSHKVEMIAPKGITIKADEKLKNTIHISGIDKQLVGEFASKVKAKKKPEPYKGKGIKFVGENIRRKAGKTGK